MSRSICTLLAVVGLALLGAGPAAADPYDDYRQDGNINPCDYAPGELEQTQANLPPDVLQYSPGLSDQLSAGREGCTGGGGPGATADPRQTEANTEAGIDTDGDGDADTAAGGNGRDGGGRGGEAARVPDPPAPEATVGRRLADISTPAVSASTGSDVPAWVVTILIALGLGALLFALVRFGGLSTDRVTEPLRAAFSDAGGRTADAMAELWDSVRLGR